MDALPQELLERVLAWLPVADLVALRRVCRRWRAAIAQLATDDAPFAYACGLLDLGRNAPWLQRQRGRLLASGASTADVIDDDLADLVSEFLDRGIAALPCTCGAPAVIQISSPLDGAPHDIGLRPARWALLAPERALALKVSALATNLKEEVSIFNLSTYSHGGGCTNEWLPVWFYLPTDMLRPTNAMQLHHFAVSLSAEVDQNGTTTLLAKLAEPSFARAFYADAEKYLGWRYNAPLEKKAFDWEPPTAWMEAAHPDVARGPDVGPGNDAEKLSRAHYHHFERAMEDVWKEGPLFAKAAKEAHNVDVTGLEALRLEARQAAAGWRICRALNWTGFLNFGRGLGGFDSILLRLRENGKDTDDEAIQSYLDSRVAAADQAVAEIQQTLHHAVVIGRGGGGPIWVLGLSRGGHLVGAVTYETDTD